MTEELLIAANEYRDPAFDSECERLVVRLADALLTTPKIERKALEMRNAIDQIEGALMGAGELIDIPDRFEESRDDLLVMPKITLGQLRRITRSLSECTRIINSNEFDPSQFSGGTCSGGENG